MFSICHFLTTCNIVSWFTSSSSFTHMFESTHIWRNSQSDTRVPCLRKDWQHHQMQKFHTNVIKYTDNLLHCCIVFAPSTILSHLAKWKILTSCPKKSDDLFQWQNCPNRLRDIHMIAFISHNHPLSFAQADEELEWRSKLYGTWEHTKSCKISLACASY